MIKVNFFVLATDYNIKFRNHLVSIVMTYLLWLPKCTQPQLNKCTSEFKSKLKVFDDDQLPFGLKTAFCLVIKDTRKQLAD